MGISDLILSRQANHEEKKRVKELSLIRTILLLCAAFTLLLRYVFMQSLPPGYDPVYIRVAFSALFLLILLLTFIEKLQSFTGYLIHAVFGVYTFYMLALVLKNGFAIHYTLGFLLVIIVVCLSFTKKAQINTYLGIVFLSYAFACLLNIEDTVQALANIGLLVIFASVILVFFDLKFRTETMLRIREDLLNTIFNESPDSLFLVDPATALIVNCNDRTLRMFHISDRKTIIGNHLNYLQRYPYSPGAWKNLKKKVGKKRFLMQEIEFKTQNVQFFWGSQAITEIVVGGDMYWLVRITDITERVRDKKTIEEHRKMLHQIIDLVPHMIFLKDDRGRYMVVNKAVADYYHTTTEKMIGKKESDFLPEEEARRVEADDMEVIESGQEKFISEELTGSLDGKKRIWQTTKLPFYMDDEKRPGLLGISIDITERVENKRAIEDNRKMLMKIINVLPHQVYLKDKMGRFLIINQVVADYHERRMDDIIGRSDFDLFPPDDAQHFFHTDQEVLKTGKPLHNPEEYFHHKGVVRINNTTKMPFFINEKNEVGILGINIDITEAKLAEKKIKESEAKYRMLMEQASDGIYLCDQEGNILDANLKAAEMFGYSHNEFIGLNIKDLIDPQGVPDAFFRIPNNKDRQSIIVERRFLKKDKTPFTVELSAKLLDDGRHQAIIRDITERKKLEHILKDNERKFRALIENSSDIIIILSEDFKLKYVSPSVARILGFKAESIVNKFIFEFIHPEDIDIISKFLYDMLSSTGESRLIDEVRIMGGKGEYIFAEVVAANLLRDPVIQGIIINCHDITKRKITEKELLNTNFELDSFVYKASHDLKAPLRSVMGLIKLAKLETKDEKQHLYLDMMNKSVLSLDQFIKDLTQFSRNSRLGIEAKLVDFEDLINESLGNLRFMENVDKVKVNKKYDIHSKFYSDLTRLSTIFNNLISNAYKYHRFENNNPYINISIETDCDKAVIIVEDNGQGIDPLHVDRIFEMFYRASETSYGSGLGLYIVKNAINKLNGTIRVQSVVNQGTTFRVEIPNLINKVEKNEGEC